MLFGRGASRIAVVKATVVELAKRMLTGLAPARSKGGSLTAVHALAPRDKKKAAPQNSPSKNGLAYMLRYKPAWLPPPKAKAYNGKCIILRRPAGQANPRF